MSSSRSTLLGQRHLILSQNTEAFNVIELAIWLILLVAALNSHFMVINGWVCFIFSF